MKETTIVSWNIKVLAAEEEQDYVTSSQSEIKGSDPETEITQ